MFARHLIQRSLLALALLGAAIATPGTAAAEVGDASWTDFNGDEFADLAVGAPGDRLGPHAAGSVTVYYGNATGGLGNTGRQFWSQSTGSGELDVPDFSEAGDRWGAALAAGDFDDDGFGDLAIGAPGEDVPKIGGPVTWVDAGQVTILWGSEDGLTALGSIRIHSFQPDDVRAGMQFGAALVALDSRVNTENRSLPGEDGRADLVIGAPGTSAHGADEGGSIETIDGGHIAKGAGIVVPSGATTHLQDGARFGSVLAAAELNDDPADELLVGVPLFDVTLPGGGVAVDAGMVSELGRQGQNGIPGRPATGDLFGSAIAVGDVNGDGRDDIAIGSPGEDGQASNAGNVTLLFQQADGTFTNTLLHEDQGRVPDTAEAGDRFGSATEIGEFGRGPNADIAIAVPRENIGGVPDAGAVDVLYTSNAGLPGASSQRFRQGGSGLNETVDAGDRFGEVLYSADFGRETGTPVDDLAIGIPREDYAIPADSDLRNAGRFQVIYGSAVDGLSTASDELYSQFTSDPSPPADNDRFGASFH